MPVFNDPSSPVGKSIPLFREDIERLRQSSNPMAVAEKAYNLDSDFRNLVNGVIEKNSGALPDAFVQRPELLLNKHYYGQWEIEEMDDLTAELSKPQEKTGIFSGIAETVKGVTGGFAGPGVDISGPLNTLSEGIQREGQQLQGSFARQQAGTARPIDTAATALSGAGQVFGETAFSTAGALAGTVTPDPIERGLKESFAERFADIADSKVGEAIIPIFERYERLKQEDPTAAQRIDSALGIGEIIGAFVGAPGVKKAGQQFVNKIDDASRARVAAREALSETTKKQADDTIASALKTSDASMIREAAESTKSKIGIREKIAGVRPDVKKRIAGKKDKLKEYFNIAHSRNLDDTVPTPLEFAAKNVEEARDALKNTLNDTGSKIGKFRKKIATVKVGSDQVDRIEDTFGEAIESLNLTIKNGKVARRAGKVKGKVSDTEVRALQNIFDDIREVKKSPTVENLIDLRKAIDDRVNFAKTAREASNVVDPVSRKTRSVIRDINLDIIGKEQGSLLDQYSELITVLDDMNKFVDSRSGAEFLLKRVLSERGRIPREIIDQVREITGVDLMDDAVMAQLATEIIGNAAQKGLFRQEIAKAGLDAMDIVDAISGAPGGTARAAKTLMQPAKNVVAPVEKTFLKAAE